MILSTDSEARSPGFEYQLSHTLAVQVEEVT